MRPAREAGVTPTGFHYAGYGLRIRSELRLPFRPAPPGVPPDLTIRSGRDIVVDRAAESEADARVFLLSTVLAACLQQRGVLTLHASAVETGTGAVLFAGASGAGKSTLLAALVDRGFRMLADDMTGVILDAGTRPVALDAFPAVRLWADAVDALSWRDRIEDPVRVGIEKYAVPVASFRPSPLSVRAVFILGSYNRRTIEIEPVTRGGAFAHLFRHTYRRRFLHGMGRQHEHFRALTALARRVSVVRVGWPSHPSRPVAVADEVERRLRAGTP